jgi:hypothetical protein
MRSHRRAQVVEGPAGAETELRRIGAVQVGAVRVVLRHQA